MYLDEIADETAVSEEKKELNRESKKDLELCPFCGSDDAIRSLNDERFHVLCDKCGARGPGATTSDAAINLWNRDSTDKNELAKALTDILKNAQKVSYLKHQPVNWADLYFEIDDLHKTYVTVSEVSPEAGNFRQYVLEELRKRGFENVIVRTEW